ncbi:MAG: hypothetical protein ACHRXM_15450 [Isosphaerales bacterium]
MFSTFTPLALIRASQGRRAVQTRPARFRHPGRNRAWFQLEGLERRCLLSGISSITSFHTPTQGNGAGSIWGITTGPDGNLWFTESKFSKIAVINPTTDAISEFPTPTAGSTPEGIAAGPDGNLWFTEYSASEIGMINPTTHVITEFKTPTRSAGPQDITAGPDGNLWFTEYAVNKIGVINPTTHVITEYNNPAGNSAPYGITTGPDGNLWFTMHGTGAIGEINPTTHVITDFAAPGGNEIATGPDGNLWYGSSTRITKFNPTTHVVTSFATTYGPVGVTAGPDGNIWFTEGEPLVAHIVARINPTTGAVTEYPASLPVFEPWGITTGPDGNLWFTQYGGASVVDVATLSSSELVVTQPPPASVTAGSSFGFAVQAEDSSGNPITSFNGTVTVAMGINLVGATLGGTLSVTASNGVATFSGLTLNTASSRYALYTSGGGFGWGVTNLFSVTAATATQLVIAQQPPATVKVSTGFGLQAYIEDQYGNMVTTAANTVSVAFANNPAGATLGGTLSVTASQGVATFSGLTINKVGNGYTLQVSSSGLSSAVTSAINVTKNGMSNAIVAPAATGAPDPLLAPPVLDSPDLLDSVGLKKRARWA